MAKHSKRANVLHLKACITWFHAFVGSSDTLRCPVFDCTPIFCRHVITSESISLISHFTSRNLAIDTNIVSPTVKFLLAGLPLVPVPRIAGSVFYSVTDPDPATNACPWMLQDGGPLLRLDKESLKGDVYSMISSRAQELSRCVVCSCSA